MSRDGTIFGHPKGLYVLFFTEMWERFSYYGMRALLMLYMVNYFKWTQEHASSIYKWYTSLVYLTPLLGGFLADRYLGNKRAIVIGATLMAIGHFCMAFEEHAVFYAALLFLIIGNGLFKPNMSTQVGRLYPANDPRRDSAYTIFYMGINLGAFLSPIICGWLRMNTKWEFHAGFTAAGIGMVLGLVIYLVGLPWVKELPEGMQYEPPEGERHEKGDEEHYMSETEARTTPSVSPWLSDAGPAIFTLLAILSLVGSVAFWFTGVLKWDNALAFGLGGGFTSLMGAYILRHVTSALRDRVIAIFIVGLFVVFFWGAFEQAGNAMTIFADKTTDRYLTQETSAPSIYPAPGGEKEGSGHLLNPVSTEWFQSINPIAIFLFAPLFAWLWVYLPRKGIELSIPAKVGIGVFLQGLAFALMMWSVQFENGATSASLGALPRGVTVDGEGRVVFRDVPDLDKTEAFESLGTESIDATSVEKLKVVNGGRIRFDEASDTLNMNGVLSDTDRDRLLRATASPAFVRSVKALADQTTAAPGDSIKASVTLDSVPEGLDLRYSGFTDEQLSLDPETRKLTATVALSDKDYKAVLVAGAEPAFRDALNELYVASAKYKVSAMWLFWFYILCTLGELCLSPVGLSMVSKLAPVRFGTMLMGVWLMTSFFGNFLAGFAGESYGAVHPTKYFMVVVLVVGAAALVCFLCVRKITAMMHGVK